MQHTEASFEVEICEHLAAHGWWYSADDTGFDARRALLPEDVFAWLEETQPEELAKIVKPSASAADQARQRERLLDRLVKVLDTPMAAGGGTLNVLRFGFKDANAQFQMCQFQPSTTLNARTSRLYERVRARVMRQVHFSTETRQSVDLVLFINGLPVATCELKTDFTQSVEDAKRQYRETRLPRDPETKREQPLFGFGMRALVHFAVSNDEVWMTTKLAGRDTVFLPFNRGWDGGAGNPPAAGGVSATAYLWQRVWDRDAWLDIVGRFMHIETKKKTDPITGKTATSTTLLFPRFHQWEAVTGLVETARGEGPGHRYLVQHSAGSGKTNSIAWLTHRLATLHDSDNQKVFDSVIVVTDRNVLDDQLQDAIKQIDRNPGMIASITGDEAGREGMSSKSELLAQALSARKPIIVVTIQTFPFVMEQLGSNAGLRDRCFAVIADEAHSSQTGATAAKLKDVLSAEHVGQLEAGEQVDIDAEATLLADMEARADASHISYFAFTATPKAKTLELFGRANADGVPEAFHVYTMQQAIEEEFILDVLANYTTYDTAFQLAQNATSQATTVGTDETGELVDQGRATRGLMRWVQLHPTNIAQKVQIIVEHFRENIAGLIGGHAKAMVVTGSRQVAVRYKLAFDTYVAKHDYGDVTVLAAFSGEVDDPEAGPQTFTEQSMNPGLRGRDLRSAFATDEYRIMLVADKFQTGFDEPLLAAMYVDKKLSGVTAVQTLSRLNRQYKAGGKDAVYVLDFANEADEILEAFKPYYKAASLERPTDPNIIHDLQAKLDAAGIYTDEDIEATVYEWLKSTGTTTGNNALAAAIDPAKRRFREAYTQASQQGDKGRVDELDMFRKDVSTYVRLYDFLSQILNYADTDLEKRAIFLRLLERQIQARNVTQDIDFSEVELVHIKHNRDAPHKLDLNTGEKTSLPGITAAGSGQQRDPAMVKLQEVLDKLNDLFGDEAFTPTETENWVTNLVTVLMENQTLVDQAHGNTESQFLASPDLKTEILTAVLTNKISHDKMADIMLEDGTVQVEVIDKIGELVYTKATASEE